MNAAKDEKAQVYFIYTTQDGTVEAKYRKFIYNKSRYDDGGLWVNARELKAEEKVSNSIAQNVQAVQFRFNRNTKITTDCKIIYRGAVYDIERKDEMDFRSREIKVVAKKSNDKTKYRGDVYEQ